MIKKIHKNRLSKVHLKSTLHEGKLSIVFSCVSQRFYLFESLLIWYWENLLNLFQKHYIYFWDLFYKYYIKKICSRNIILEICSKICLIPFCLWKLCIHVYHKIHIRCNQYWIISHCLYYVMVLLESYSGDK